MKNKVTTLSSCIQTIPSGATIGIGGNTLNRSPMSLVRELVRQNKTNLKLVKTAGALDIDMLCLAEQVSSVDAGFISFETTYGLANNYRKSVQTGTIKANEHACYTVMSALRAGKANIPFMPVYGLQISDLIEANDYFKQIKDPFSNNVVTIVKAIQPDVSIIHVHAADRFGNAEIQGPMYDDVLLAKSSKRVIISTEKLVQPSYFINNPRKVDISGVVVNDVVVLQNGAKPSAMPKRYGVDNLLIREYQTLKTKEELRQHLKKYDFIDTKKQGWTYAN